MISGGEKMLYGQSIRRRNSYEDSLSQPEIWWSHSGKFQAGHGAPSGPALGILSEQEFRLRHFFLDSGV
jgi:hypothetical protein